MRLPVAALLLLAAMTLFMVVFLQYQAAGPPTEDLLNLLQSLHEQGEGLSAQVTRLEQRLGHLEVRPPGAAPGLAPERAEDPSGVQDGSARAPAESAVLYAPGATSHCPKSHPFLFRQDDGEFARHCCSVLASCHGRPECCGGEQLQLPITYVHEPPREEVRCEDFSWWRLLEGKKGPLWQLMKADATPRSKADSDAMKAMGFGERKVTWAGEDADLQGADTAKVRGYVGSSWLVSGNQQMQGAKAFMGLAPHQRFLEIGCGALNAGQFFMDFFKAGSYVCVEPNEVLHRKSAAANASISKIIGQKRPEFITRDDFDPRPKMGNRYRFDRAWSHSVLSHAADWQLMQYFEVVAATINPDGGVAMASLRFSDVNGVSMEASHDHSWIYPSVSYFDFGEARCLARRAGLHLEAVPEARLFHTQTCPNEFHDWVRLRLLKNGF